MERGTGWAETPLGGSWEREEELLQSFAREIQQIIERLAPDHGGPRRGNHAKVLAATTRATIVVSGDEHAGAGLRRGPFARPGASYPATVRFSNASSRVRPSDALRDLRGVAVRVFADDGEYDFLMTNADPNHARNASQTMAVTAAAASAHPLAGLVHLVRRVGLAEALRILRMIRVQTARPVESLATETYWSRAAVAIGDDPDSPQRSVAVKYQLTALASPSARPEPAENLGQELRVRLARGAVRFLFQVQRFLDEARTPIEDASVAWPVVPDTLAELILPQQDLLQADRDIVEALDFSPWHVNRRVIKPIGNMNRARGVVYRASVACRRPGEEMVR